MKREQYSVFANYHEYLWACCMEIPENECLALALKHGRESERQAHQKEDNECTLSQDLIVEERLDKTGIS